MASTATSSSAAFFLVVNLLFFTLVTACAPSPPPPSPPPPPKVTPCPPPPKPSPPPPAPVYKPPCPPAPTTPTPTYPPTAPAKCPVDTLKFGVCAETLGGLINATAGAPPKTPCCPLIQGLVDLEAAVCLCTAIKASVLGINLNIPISLSLLVNFCGKSVPPGFQCP